MLVKTLHFFLRLPYLLAVIDEIKNDIFSWANESLIVSCGLEETAA